MAGEFLQLLASLERQKKTEVDADMRLSLATDLQRRRDDAAAHRADLARKQQANMYILSHELSNKKANELEIKTKENALEALGVVINEHSVLKSDDQTQEAQDILELTYDKGVRELDYNQLVDQNVSEKIQSVIDINSDYQDRNEVLDEKLRTYEAVDESLKEMSKQFFQPEFKQALESSDFTGEWVVDDKEMAAFIAVNKKDFTETVAKFGGDSAEVERRLRSHFSQYSKEQMETLNDVYTIQNQKLNILANRIELGLAPAPLAMVAERMQEQLTADSETFNTIMTSMSPDFEEREMEDDPILRHLDGQTYTAQMGIAGKELWNSRADQRMASVLSALDDYDVMTQDIPSEFRNDYEALALWYSGQIVRLKDFKEKHKEKGYESSSVDFKDKTGNEYMYVDNVATEEEYSKERIGELDWKDADFENPENVLYGAQQFFREYAKGKQMSRHIDKNRNLLRDSTGITYDPVTGDYSKRTIPDRRGNEVTDNAVDQKDLDTNDAIIQFSKDFNMDAVAIRAKSENAGMDVIDWMNQHRERATRPSFHLNEKEAKHAYDIEWDEGRGQPASVVGAEIIDIIEEITRKKKIASEEWLEAEGDDQIQRTRRGIFNDTGYLGQEFEELHEEGSYYIDDLKEIREIARKSGNDVGLWDYYLESQIGEDVVMGTRKVYTDDPLSIFSPKQLFPWEERGLAGGALRAAPLVGKLFQPIEEEDIILEAREGVGLLDQYRHRSQYDLIRELESKAAIPEMWLEPSENIPMMDEITVTP